MRAKDTGKGGNAKKKEWIKREEGRKKKESEHR